MSELTPIVEEVEQQPARKPRRWLRRLGCLIVFPIWLVIMLIPCFFITLAFQQQITISQGDAPGQVLRIWLINEVDHRGLGISSTSVHPASQEDGFCVQTDVRFILWTGESEPTSYCDCYAPPEGSDGPELTSTYEGVCVP